MCLLHRFEGPCHIWEAVPADAYSCQSGLPEAHLTVKRRDVGCMCAVAPLPRAGGGVGPGSARPSGDAFVHAEWEPGCQQRCACVTLGTCISLGQRLQSSHLLVKNSQKDTPGSAARDFIPGQRLNGFMLGHFKWDPVEMY